VVQPFGPADQQTGLDDRGGAHYFPGPQEVRQQVGRHFEVLGGPHGQLGEEPLLLHAEEESPPHQQVPGRQEQ